MKKYIYLLPVLFSTLLSCNYLDREPIGQVIPETASDFRALLTTAYQTFPSHKNLLTVRADEVDMDFLAAAYDGYKDIATWNDETADWKTYSFPYVSMYQTIFYANHIINAGPDVTPDAGESIKQVMAEAYCLRAYAHFELVNLYAQPYNQATAKTDRGVVISYTVDIAQDHKPAKVQEVYDQIWADIQKADELMETEAQQPTLRYRFSKQSLAALKSRIALYQADWTKTLEYAREGLAMNNSLENLNDSDAVNPAQFKSKECLLSLERVTNQDLNSIDFYISSKLTSAYDKENDKRFELFFKKQYGDYFNKKFASNTDRLTFRVAELYLNAAEAAAQLGNEADAKQYLTELAKNRLNEAGLTTYTDRLNAATGNTLIEEIYTERLRELALEGTRWYDLRRTTRPAISKMLMNPATFEPEFYSLDQNDKRYTLPFPKEAIQSNPNLQD